MPHGFVAFFGLLLVAAEVISFYQPSNLQIALGIFAILFVPALLYYLFQFLFLAACYLLGVVLVLPFVLLKLLFLLIFPSWFSSESGGKEQGYTFEDALEKVRSLEAERKRKGFKPGWLYHQCKYDPLLLEALEYLRTYGDIPGGEKSYSHQQEQSENTSQSSGKNTKEDSHENTQKPFDPYEVLGVSRGASKDAIKQSYREQMKLYHPDKVAHLGEALRELATKKAKEIQRAFEMLSA